MSRYDTSAQARGRRERRRLNVVLGVALLALAAYILASYVLQSLGPDPPETTFGVVIGLFVIFLAVVPISQALVRRPHPTSIEVRDDALVLRYDRGPPVRLAWEARPVPLAYDTRKVEGKGRGAEGMEVQMYVELPGRDGRDPPLRPVEVDLSGKAFDEVRERQVGAGLTERSRRWSRRRPGDLVEFLRPGEGEDDPPWPEGPSGLGRLDRGGSSAAKALDKP